MTLSLAIYALINIDCYSIKVKDYYMVTFYVKFISEEIYLKYANVNFCGLENFFSDALANMNLPDYVIESEPILLEESDNINYEHYIDFVVY